MVTVDLGELGDLYAQLLTLNCFAVFALMGLVIGLVAFRGWLD